MLLRRVLLVSLLARGRAQCSSDCTPGDGTLCVGDRVPLADASEFRAVCYPTVDGTPSSVALTGATDGADDAANKIVVVSNYYAGCNAGRREASAFAWIAQTLADAHANVRFVSGLKGGSSCAGWGATYESYAESTWGVAIEQQPLTVYDDDSTLRDLLFTAPYPHPSYAILDWNRTVRHKFVGPCCGYTSWSSCALTELEQLNRTISGHVRALLSELAVYEGANVDCVATDWSAWSA